MDVKHRESGQAAVETAIVMPLMVFLILGIIQMNLLYQARLLSEYAAYRAVRSGALNNANVPKMEAAALSVLVAGNPRPAFGGGSPHVPKTSTSTSYVAELAILRAMNAVGPDSLEIADVKICGPLRGGNPSYIRTHPNGSGTQSQPSFQSNEADFDDWRRTSYGHDPNNNSLSDAQAIERFKRGKLRIQLTYNYVMPIPFANQILSRIWLGQQIVETLRLQRRQLIPTGDLPTSSNATNFAAITAMSATGVYIMPIRAEYNMRMHSNVYRRNLPTQNECVTWGNQS